MLWCTWLNTRYYTTWASFYTAVRVQHTITQLICLKSLLSIIVECYVHIQSGLLLLICRCRHWVQASLRDYLRDKSTEYLSANCKLCADHFEPGQFMNSQYRTKLVWNSVPTVFQVPNPPRPIDGAWKPPKKRKLAVDPRLPTSVAKRKKIQSKHGCCFVFYNFYMSV